MNSLAPNKCVAPWEPKCGSQQKGFNNNITNNFCSQGFHNSLLLSPYRNAYKVLSKYTIESVLTSCITAWYGN